MKKLILVLVAVLMIVGCSVHKKETVKVDKYYDQTSDTWLWFYLMTTTNSSSRTYYISSPTPLSSIPSGSSWTSMSSSGMTTSVNGRIVTVKPEETEEVEEEMTVEVTEKANEAPTTEAVSAVDVSSDGKENEVESHEAPNESEGGTPSESSDSSGGDSGGSD